ncbi:arginine-specific demethylase JMJ20 [Salvia miltiorrhiza]|uniref:arginine-specific demethylase JMJ20 n=1 Tax=Salvia miltiorrhiza TaxID=226208 RepID=UPI0025AC5F07|nr:arginine-specific demethylase JMJ20 [Salvia miltiorrhiza]XP_057804466.1 arginine-specific demethylase JMJ20 [Salvia miltiorrhiza]XP_057804467.1 arginine-specific demethylase JMJ20 [Salvia miltiorrhiza]
MGLKIEGKVEKVNGKELSYAEFVEKYLDKNQPVILTGLTDDWRARKDWVSGDGKPNLRFFSDQFGGSRVQVADCAKREFTDQKRLEMSVSEFIEIWINSSNSDNGGADGKPLLYLKDWHFVKEYPDYVAYSTPVFFRDDWLNLYLDEYHMHDDPETYRERNEVNCSDYRFVYMGAKGTWTPLHADVFRSYSWSANVCGRKQWYFLCPSQHHLVFDRYMKSAVYNIFEDVCKSKYPGFEEAVWLECTQERDEIIFVPSGWYHQVHNLEDTISINHNWFNAYSISWVWGLLLREYHEAAGYIEDLKDICDDFEVLCQRNLAANAGMDFRDFFIFLFRFSLANFLLLYQITSSKGFLHWCSSEAARFLLFNLKSIKCITLQMKSEAGWQNCGFAAIDLVETIEDPAFMDFYNTLGIAYSMMYNFSEIDFSESRNILEHEQISVLYPFGSHICNPDNLITFLGNAFKLVGTEG